MTLLAVILLVSLIATLALVVAYEQLFDKPVTLIPLTLAGLTFLVLIAAETHQFLALGSAGVFLLLVGPALFIRWSYTSHGRLERAYWRKSNQEILGCLFRRYSLNEQRNRATTEEIWDHLGKMLPREWLALIGEAARELAAVKVTSLHMRSLGISPTTADAYARTADIAGDHLWRVTERVAAVIAHGYSSPGIEERLEAERDRVEKLVAAASSAREALAELTLGDTGSSELEGAELQLRTLTSATKELEIV